MCLEKMENIEMLSNVKVSLPWNELEDIMKLWQLMKLSVVIRDSDIHLQKLLQMIGVDTIFWHVSGDKVKKRNISVKPSSEWNKGSK
jgi:hypothetical protein